MNRRRRQGRSNNTDDSVLADIQRSIEADRDWFHAHPIETIEFYLAAVSGQVERDGDEPTYPFPPRLEWA